MCNLVKKPVEYRSAYRAGGTFEVFFIVAFLGNSKIKGFVSLVPRPIFF